MVMYRGHVCIWESAPQPWVAVALLAPQRPELNMEAPIDDVFHCLGLLLSTNMSKLAEVSVTSLPRW